MAHFLKKTLNLFNNCDIIDEPLVPSVFPSSLEVIKLVLSLFKIAFRSNLHQGGHLQIDVGQDDTLKSFSIDIDMYIT